MRSVILTVFACLMVWTFPAIADNQRPSVVKNVRAEGVSGPAIIVSWSQGRDNVGVDGYNIYRDGNYFKTVGKTTSYIDRNLRANREYRYTIVAFDRARNYSSKSGSAKARSGNSSSPTNSNPSPVANPNELSKSKPSAPSGLKATVQSSSSAKLSWNSPSGGAEGYNVYKDGKYFTTVKGRNTYTATSLKSSRSYVFHVVAFRHSRYSTKSARITVRTSSNDTTTTTTPTNTPTPTTTPSPPPTSSGKPAAPTGLKATVLNSSSAKLSWNAPSGGAEGYNVYRDGKYFATVKGRRDYTANSLSSGRSYSFRVVAFRSGRYSTKSSSVTVKTSGNSTTPSPPPPVENSGNSAVPDGYKLVFSDEFTSSSIKSSKWNTRYRWGADLIINNEKQYYVDALNDRNFGVNPFKLSSGRLTIQATKTPSKLRNKANGQKYLSGAMTTYNKFQMKYGYVEIRAKLPKGKGLWPAFWLLHGANSRSKPEIDVMEMLGDNTRLVYQTYHYYDSNWNLRSTPSFRAPGPDYSKAFHTFGMLWEKGRITWYVDGKRTNRFTSSKVSDEHMYILVNLALGGNWAGSPNSSTSFPAKYEIDYIRAYQKR